MLKWLCGIIPFKNILAAHDEVEQDRPPTEYPLLFDNTQTSELSEENLQRAIDRVGALCETPHPSMATIQRFSDYEREMNRIEEQRRDFELESQSQLQMYEHRAMAISSASCASSYLPSSWWGAAGYNSNDYVTVDSLVITPISRKEERKPFKAECRAQMLMQEMIGMDEWRVYRRTARVRVDGDFTWFIGNVLNGYDKFRPQGGKVEVMRIDGNVGENLLATTFCVETTGESVTWTDRVISMAAHCADDEKGFYKTANRIREHRLNGMPEAARWGGE